MRPLTIALAAALAVAPALAAQPAADAAPEAAVQALMDATNRRDLDAMVARYAPDAAFYRHPETPHWADVAKMREEFAQLFEAMPDLRVEVAGRIVHGDRVVQQERYFAGDPAELLFTATILYEVGGGRIRNLWVLHTD